MPTFVRVHVRRARDALSQIPTLPRRITDGHYVIIRRADDAEGAVALGAAFDRAKGQGQHFLPPPFLPPFGFGVVNCGNVPVVCSAILVLGVTNPACRTNASPSDVYNSARRSNTTV